MGRGSVHFFGVCRITHDMSRRIYLKRLTLTSSTTVSTIIKHVFNN